MTPKPKRLKDRRCPKAESAAREATDRAVKRYPKKEADVADAKQKHQPPTAEAWAVVDNAGVCVKSISGDQYLSQARYLGQPATFGTWPDARRKYNARAVRVRISVVSEEGET